MDVSINDEYIGTYSTLEEVYNLIHEYYVQESDVCINELMACVSINGISVEDAVFLYAELHYNIEGDRVVRIVEGEEKNLYMED